MGKYTEMSRMQLLGYSVQKILVEEMNDGVVIRDALPALQSSFWFRLSPKK